MKPNQKAYVFVTNMPFHRVLDSDKPGHCMMGFGLGIIDFGKEESIRLSEMYRRSKRHADAYTAVDSFKKYPQGAVSKRKI